MELLRDLESRFPDMAQVITIGSSIEGRELNVIKISDNVGNDETEPNIFIVGCHHAREWISVEVPLLFAQYLLENYSGNADVRRAVNRSQIYIMPIQNPDGLEFSIHVYRMWRKNRRYNGNLSWGVDTNRNYGYMWG
ncbi:MAG: zinc carboxypeptidase, partial [bacterium]|nr:zinc carboxypeptidase [bacterium]